MVLEILKMTIRTLIVGKIGDQRKSLRQKELDLEKELNQIKDLKMITKLRLKKLRLILMKEKEEQFL